MANPAEIDQSIKVNNIKPIFSDGFIIGFRFKAKNIKPVEVKLEDITATGGLIEVIFVDEGKQQALGRFIMDRDIAENLSKALTESIKKFDEAMLKGGLTKIMPKQTPTPSDNTYR